jgi:ankyrin repeat protein
MSIDEKIAAIKKVFADGNVSITEYLSNGKNLLFAFNEYAIIKLLLDMGLRNREAINCVDSANRNCLFYLSGNYEVVKLLIDAGINLNQVDIHGQNILFRLSLTDDPESLKILALLLNSGVNANQCDNYKRNILFLDRCYPETMKMLIKAGANVNQVNWKGKTPLFVKRDPQGNKKAIAKILIDAGACSHVNFIDDGGDDDPYY